MKLSNLFLVTALSSVSVTAADSTAIVAIDFDKLDYKTSLRWPEVRSAMVTGHPTKAGLYTTHAWMASGSIVPPHTHPDPRITVVTHGTMYVGVGTVYDESALVAYPQGSVFITPHIHRP